MNHCDRKKFAPFFSSLRFIDEKWLAKYFYYFSDSNDKRISSRLHRFNYVIISSFFSPKFVSACVFFFFYFVRFSLCCRCEFVCYIFRFSVIFSLSWILYSAHNHRCRHGCAKVLKLLFFLYLFVCMFVAWNEFNNRQQNNHS